VFKIEDRKVKKATVTKESFGLRVSATIAELIQWHKSLKGFIFQAFPVQRPYF
jgi:hypothetical protein